MGYGVVPVETQGGGFNAPRWKDFKNIPMTPVANRLRRDGALGIDTQTSWRGENEIEAAMMEITDSIIRDGLIVGNQIIPFDRHWNGKIIEQPVASRYLRVEEERLARGFPRWPTLSPQRYAAIEKEFADLMKEEGVTVRKKRGKDRRPRQKRWTGYLTGA
jgi:hypothetical protein